MTEEGLPEWRPYSIKIITYQSVSGEVETALTRLNEIFDGDYSKSLDILHFQHNSVLGFVKKLVFDNSISLLVAVGPKDEEKIMLEKIPEYEEYDEVILTLEGLLSEAPDSTCRLRFIYANNIDGAKKVLREYIKVGGRAIRSSGFVKDSILTTLETTPNDSTTQREMLLIPYSDSLDSAVESIWNILFEISHVNILVDEMKHLYSTRRLMFDQMDASEGNTQIWINEILAKMRRPVDDIQPDDLEDILKEITIQFSRLSTLSSSIRRDHVKAKDLLWKLRNTLARWNEKPKDNYQMNSTVEIADFENMMIPFGNFVERVEAILAQLNTLLDSVRTYLGIKQQKLSLVEQSSSREQLIRLVNLQEILHKLEVLIIAVYLTEMAHIIFETLAHETAGLLTASFIPVALVISILLIRILHKPH